MLKTPLLFPTLDFLTVMCIALLLPLSVLAVTPADTSAKAGPHDSVAKKDTTRAAKPLSDSGATQSVPGNNVPTAIKKNPLSATDSSKASAKDSFDVRTGSIIGGGIGLSIGSVQVFGLWKNGLPQSLADFGLTDSSFKLPGDTLQLAFTVKQEADVYNMIFPLTVSFGRLFRTHRYEAAISFSMLSKTSQSSVSIGNDSVGRRIDISQSLGLYSISFDFLYGTEIPIRYFSIDGADRTDFIAGVSITPFVSLSKTNDITGTDSASDPRLWAVRDSIVSRLNTVSATGIAFGWRLGIAKLRRLSKNGAIEGRICYCGTWSTLFRKPSAGSLTEKEISVKSGDPGRKVSWVSNRFEISVALVHKL